MTILDQARKEIKLGHDNAVDWLTGKVNLDGLIVLKKQLSHERHIRCKPCIDIERALAQVIYG